jgi:hypothetical protein
VGLVLSGCATYQPGDFGKHVITDLACISVAGPIAAEIGMSLTGPVSAGSVVLIITQALSSGQAQAVLNACEPVLENLKFDIAALQGLVTAKVAVEKAGETRARVKAMHLPK